MLFLMKVACVLGVILCDITQAFVSDFRLDGRNTKGKYDEYPKSPYPIITHPHSAQKAAMQVHVVYHSPGGLPPWGTSAPAELTKAPPGGSYTPLGEYSGYAPPPASPYQPRYQPGAKEAGLIPESHPQSEGGYGYGGYGSDARYGPGYDPLSYSPRTPVGPGGQTYPDYGKPIPGSDYSTIPGRDYKGYKSIPESDYSDYKPIPGSDYREYKPIPGRDYKGYKPIPGSDYKGYKPIPGSDYKGYNPIPGSDYKEYKPIPGRDYSTIPGSDYPYYKSGPGYRDSKGYGYGPYGAKSGEYYNPGSGNKGYGGDPGQYGPSGQVPVKHGLISGPATYGLSGLDYPKYGPSMNGLNKGLNYGPKPGTFGYKSHEYIPKSIERGPAYTVHGPDGRYEHPASYKRKSGSYIRQSDSYRYDSSTEYRLKGFDPRKDGFDSANRHPYSFHPPQETHPWERHETHGERVTSEVYGPDKPTHGPWNHPGYRGSSAPTDRWIQGKKGKSAVPGSSPRFTGSRDATSGRNDVSGPKPLESFHVVDSMRPEPTPKPRPQPNPKSRPEPNLKPRTQPNLKSRPELKVKAERVTNKNAEPKPTFSEAQTQRKLEKASRIEAKNLEENEGSGEEEEEDVAKIGKEEEERKEEEDDDVAKIGKEEEEDDDEDDQGLPPDCKGMQMSDPKKRISPGRMALMCRLYKGWGKNMKSGKKWKPTQKQDDWFSSLGSHRGGARRRKRQAVGKALRKEYRALTDPEREAFHGAMNVLKAEEMDGLSKYDLFVNYHRATNAPGAHFGPAFLPWHREMLLRFENALREVNASISLPYWDSNLDHALGDPGAQSSIIWTEKFLGNGKGDVTTGPFKFWRLAFPSNLSQSGIIYRNLTLQPPDTIAEPRLMSDTAVLSILEADSIRNISWFVDSTFETHHGSVHNWVGGVLADLPIAPSDPVFYLHHAFIDCLWEQMRHQQRVDNIDVRFDYPNDSLALGVGQLQPDGATLASPEASAHYALAIMQPFRPLRNIDGLAEEYFDEFYDCAPSPFCSELDADCGSPYLFCEQATLRCLPRLSLGALCAGFAVSEPCYASVCCMGRCRATCEDENT